MDHTTLDRQNWGITLRARKNGEKAKGHEM